MQTQPTIGGRWQRSGNALEKKLHSAVPIYAAGLAVALYGLFQLKAAVVAAYRYRF